MKSGEFNLEGQTYSRESKKIILPMVWEGEGVDCVANG
jgi:hypothetical protein